MAAAYAFHICESHPFVDGNKRAGTAAMIAFLSDNGWAFDGTADEAEPIILDLAGGRLSKDALTLWLGKHCHEKPRMELREFFASVRVEHLLQHQRSAKAAPDAVTQFTVSGAEASRAIPLLEGLHSLFGLADNDDDRRWAGAQFGLLVSLYRIAEDMGYEW